MNTTSGIGGKDRNRTAPYLSAAPPSRQADSPQTDFSQSVREATGQTREERAVTNRQTSSVQPLTAESMAVAQTTAPGMTPLTPVELGLRQTAQELQTRQLINAMAGRLVAPKNLADYPQSVVTYAGQMSAQTSNAAFATPPGPNRVTGPRVTDVRSIMPVDPAEGGQSVEKD